MATKSTRKKPNFKPEQVAEKLDNLVSGVTKRGVYVVAKNAAGSYDLVNYITNKIMVSGLPSRDSADKLCYRYNKGQYLSKVVAKEVTDMIDRYTKLATDAMYYTHVVDNSTDNVAAEIAYMRRNFAQAHMKKIREDILKVI